MNENLFFINTYEDFLLGNLENLSIDKNIGTGAIVLSSNNNKYIEYGIYTSQVINLKTFKRLLVSWNCETPKGTWIEVQARAFISYYDDNKNSTYEWSDWLSFGKWGTHIKRSSKSPDSHLAKISTDEFIIKGNYTDTASKIQIRALLHTENTNVTPSIRQFVISYKDNTPRLKNIEIPSDKIIDVPSYSQYIRDKNIGSVICSPTSITMLLNRRNENLIVEETAWSCFDYDYEAFGNWLFNVAFASSLGYESFVEYGNLKSLKREIYSGYPVAVSVKYTNDINNLEYPYIENDPITTAGHILVVRGFEKKDGIDYVVVNDPAGKSNESVTRRYKLSEFESAWHRGSNIMYIIHDKEVEINNNRIEASLELKNNKENLYSVLVNDTYLDLSSDFVKTILITYDNGLTFEYLVPYNNHYLALENKNKCIIYIIGSDGFTYVCNC